VAGFIISRDTTLDKVQDDLTAIISTLSSKPPGGSGAVSQRASGTQGKSHDMFDQIEGTVLDVTLSTASNVATVRNELIGTLLAKQMAQLGNLPGPYGSSQTEFVIRFLTVKRVEFKKNQSGNLLDEDGKKVSDTGKPPVDSGDKSKWRLVVMGAVASKGNPNLTTGFIVDDLSNGTALARASAKVLDECDVGTITSLPKADIIWVDVSDALIVAEASPIKLEYMPISASLGVMLNGTGIKRSRTNGFNYRASHNALVFANVKYKKGSEVIAAYMRWSW
jgi:hypothetical protein